MEDFSRITTADAMRLANEACQRGFWHRAIDLYRAVIAREPASADAHCNLGVAYAQKGDLDAAIASQQRAIQLRPDCAPAYNNLGSSLLISGKFDHAAQALDHAIALKTDFAEAHFTRSLIKLLHGDFENGWKQYEWCLKARGTFMHRYVQFPQPRWDGGDLNGQTILLHAEAGFGDSIHFVRYAPLVSRRGGKVIVGCQAELAELFRSVPGIDQIITPTTPLPGFDVQCPLLSLPLAFSTTLNSIPWNGPYLQADAARQNAWANRLKDRAGFKIGLACSGNPNNRLDRWRSIPWPIISKLLSTPNATFFSLQKEKPPANSPLIDWSNELRDFNETAALLANLDLVITVDTAVAHLAGAMGKPVWVLIPASPDFRWMLDRDDSPWYPSMRLVRQAKLGSWDDVIHRVIQALAKFRAE